MVATIKAFGRTWVIRDQISYCLLRMAGTSRAEPEREDRAMLTDDELRAIEESVTSTRAHIDRQRAEFGHTQWWREDALGIRMTTAAEQLLAEVKRNRCAACSHAFSDHDLYAGTNYITCRICEAECLEDVRLDA